MLRKILCALALVLTLGAVQAQASDLLPSDILVSQRLGDSTVAGGTVELCRVGGLTESGFLLGEAFGGGEISGEEVLSPEFAFWMSRKAGPGITAAANGVGVVRFAGVEPGLYLIRQREAPEGYYPFRPYLVSITGEMTLVDTYPVMEPEEENNPHTAEPAQPYLAALGVAVTLAGFIFWEEARKQELRENTLQ